MNMRRMTYLILFIIFICIFTACQNDSIKNQNEINSQKTTEDAIQPVTVMPDTELANKEWQKISNYSQLIGKSMFAIGKTLNSFSYEWFADGSQCFMSDDGDNFIFPCSAWKDGSTCSAIQISGDNVFPMQWGNTLTEENIREYFGAEYSFHAENGEEFGYFEYSFKNFNVLFFQNDNGEISRLESSILLIANNDNAQIKDIENQNNDNFKYPSMEESFYNKEYSSYIGKTKGDIINSNFQRIVSPFEVGSWGDVTVYPGDIYVDIKSDVVYKFEQNVNDNDGTDEMSCSYVFVPVKLVLSSSDETISMGELVEYGAILWSYGEEYSYAFEHGGTIVSIPSDGNGNISMNDYIMIKAE